MRRPGAVDPAAVPLPEQALDTRELETLYEGLTFPSADKLYQIQRRRGLGYTLKDVRAFVKDQSAPQRFAPPPAKDAGHIVSLEPTDLFQADLIDMSRYSSAAKMAPKWTFILL